MKLSVIVLVVLIFLGVFAVSAQKPMANLPRLHVAHIATDIDIQSLDDAAWKAAPEVVVTSYWSGVAAPLGRQFKARLLWSATALYIRFEANQAEPLIVSDKPDLTKKMRGLWDRDVCEIFIAPNKAERNKYFEFEIAPNGEWIDLGIAVTPTKRKTDWDYKSTMTSAARIEKERVVTAIRIPFAALGKSPKAGDVWLGNLFRCVGKDPTRGYLAWQATKTKEPSFHVPSKFGEFKFVK